MYSALIVALTAINLQPYLQGRRQGGDEGVKTPPPLS